MIEPPTNERDVVGEFAAMPDPSEVLRGRLIMTKGLGLDPVAQEQAIFHYWWDRMPHLFTPLSDKVRADADAFIAKETNELLSK